MQSKEIREKSQKTSLKRYGVENPLRSKEIQEKRKQTNLEKYGVENVTKYENYFMLKNCFSESIKSILFDKTQFHNFMKNKTVLNAAKNLNISQATIRSYMKRHNVTEFDRNESSLENEMKAILEEIGINFIQNTRKVISPYELDFYLSDHQVAIEMNGDYWHSNKVILETRGMTAIEYHQMKTDRCKEKGIELIHISETAWQNFNYSTLDESFLDLLRISFAAS